MKILYLPNQYSQQRQREKKRWIYPVLLAMEAEWHRQNGDKVEWADLDMRYWTANNFMVDKLIIEPEGIPFSSLPRPDRIFTKAFDPRYQQNGNFKYLPGTYIQSANGCWHGKCTFCVENKQKWEVRPADDVIKEIKECQQLGFKEVFDDSGTFPVGDWLAVFCRDLVRFVPGIRFGCNARIVDMDFDSLSQSGFRMLLFGVESANQHTLDKVQKGVKVEDIIPTIKKASEAGLEPHIAVMFGYPWETDQDAHNTLRMVHYLLRKGFAKTAQASFYTPQTKADSDGQPQYSHRAYVRRIYNAAYHLDFWINKLRDINSVDDIKYLWRQIKAGLNWRDDEAESFCKQVCTVL